MFWETKKDLRRENERLKDRRGLDKWLIDSYKDLIVTSNERNLKLFKKNIYLEKENKKLKEEINDMKPKRDFDVGQLIEYRGDVYKVQGMMQVCVVLSGVSSNVKCTMITVDRNSSELIEL